MTTNDGSILCIGEAVWDLFPDKPRLGGAPLNAAVHLARQGLRTALLTAVGKDDLGRRCLAFLEREGIPGALVHPRLPTGTVKVDLALDGIPRFTIHAHGAWTDLEGASLAGIFPVDEWANLPDLSVIVFGGLAMHSPVNRVLFARLLETFRKQDRPFPVRLCDMNLRPGWSDPEVARWCASQADVLKVNEDELRFLEALGPRPSSGADGPPLPGYALRGLCTTMGAEGMRWTDADGNMLVLSTQEEEDVPVVIDTVGAGDAVTAAIAMGLARKEPARRFLERGRKWSAEVCGIPGAFPSASAGVSPWRS